MTKPNLFDMNFTNQPFGHDTDGLDVSQLIASAGDLNLMTAAQIAAVYRHVKDLLEQVDETRDALSGFVELIKTSKLPEAFEREDLKTITLTDGARVTVQQRTNATMIDKAAGMKWLEDNGQGDLIQPTVNASTLASFAKNVLEGGLADLEIYDLPDDIFKVTIRPTTSVTKGKGNG